MQDFCQLLRTDLSLLRTPKKDTPRYKLYGGQRMYTAVDFEDEYGIRPNQVITSTQISLNRMPSCLISCMI